MDRENTPPPTPQFGNTEIRSDEQSEHLLLPQEIIEEILALLPVKSLLRFKCVSKSWHHLIGSDRFIKVHREKSRDDKTYTHWKVIFSYREGGLKQCSRRSFVEEPSIDPSPIEDPTNKDHPVSGDIVDSCNGVLCILNKPGSFILFNPAIRFLHQLPKLDMAIHAYGFGWDEMTDAYKVFVVMLDKHNNKTSRVYCTKTNSWKTVDQGLPTSPFSGKGVLACGNIHWLVSRSHDTIIVSFDLKSEVFGEMTELPCEPRSLSLSNQCLGLMRYNNEKKLCDVWIMKEYGVKESWVKRSWLPPRKNTVSHYARHAYFESLVAPY